MKIRSITYFFDPGWPLQDALLRRAGEFLKTARSAFEAGGYEVQTTRLATIPFPRLLGDGEHDRSPADSVLALADAMSRAIAALDIGYASLGPALPESPASYGAIPEAIAASENVFFGGLMTEKDNIDLAALHACAEVIERCAPLDPNGFANLRFAALANVPAGAPFFPAAYHADGGPAFAIATEAADLAVQAFSRSSSMDEGLRWLVAELERHGKAIAGIANEAASAHRLRFTGIDFSLAPFPDDLHSLGGAVERMGVPRIGLHGSLAAAALLTDAVDRADFPHAGFSGFMQPVLEDSVLAARAADGTLTVKDLLLYSAVCGTGLDTVPLPGDTTADQIAALLLDLSALALRLDKPLTARLMPVPGRKAGDPTSFDFGFFANSRVMSLQASPLRGPLAGDGKIQLESRALNAQTRRRKDS